jgi:hypothetical protein
MNKPKKIDKSPNLADIGNFVNSLNGVIVALALSGVILKAIEKEAKMANLTAGIKHYWRVGNIKKMVEGILRYVLVWWFE